MRFDQFDDSESQDARPPEGTHECEIFKVKQVTRKSDGKSVVVMELKDVADAYDKVDKWLDPSDKRDRKAALQLLAAVGLPPDTAVDSGLEGLRVLVTTARGTKRDGTPTVYVNAFAASSNPGQPAPPPAAKPARKTAAAKTLGDDDIPF